MPGKRDKHIVEKLVVGISGSPRRGGNSDLLLDKALEGASSVGAGTEKLFLNNMDLRPCQACGGCDESGVCIIPDDMRHVYKSIERADAVIVASPIYFGSVTAQLKAMVDRFQGWWIAKYVLKAGHSRKNKRRGYFLCVAGSTDRKYFRDAGKVVRNFFATIGADYSGGLFCGGSDKTGAVKRDGKVMEKAFRLGKGSVCRYGA